MNLAALRSVLVVPAFALTLAACSQAEPPVQEFQTVTNINEPSARLASVPLPVRKPTDIASAAEADGPTVVAAVRDERMVSPTPIGPDGRPAVSREPSTQTVAMSSEHGSVTRYLKRWLPDFNKITDCPNGITCQAAFAN